MVDGGERIAGALSPWAQAARLGMGETLAFSGAIHNPIFNIILLTAGWLATVLYDEPFQRFYNPGSIPPNY
jgi:hypothetical protein